LIFTQLFFIAKGIKLDSHLKVLNLEIVSSQQLFADHSDLLVTYVFVRFEFFYQVGEHLLI